MDFECTYCGERKDFPFECNYCKDKFCADHRLPEDHRCVKLHQIRAKRFGQKSVKREKGIGRQSIFRKIFNKFKD